MAMDNMYGSTDLLVL